MRKVIVLLTLTVMIFLSAGFCYASDGVENEFSPWYQSVTYYAQAFEISNDGLARYSLTVSPKIQNMPNRVTATIDIVNSDNESVYRKTKTLTYSATTRTFTCSDTKQLTEKGEYEMQVTYKCYNGTSLMETITAAPKVETY